MKKVSVIVMSAAAFLAVSCGMPGATGTSSSNGNILGSVLNDVLQGGTISNVITSVIGAQTVTKANLHEATDMFAAAVLSGAASILVGPMMAGGRALAHPELMLSRAEWNATKDAIRALPDCGVPFTFCDEFFCECRNDQPTARLRRKWRDPNHKPCPAGRDFGVVGPTGHFRSCLHCVGA